VVSVETKRWVRFLASTHRNDLTVVRSARSEKRGQRAEIGGKHQAPDVERPIKFETTSFHLISYFSLANERSARGSGRKAFVDG
jgi:hypothetical protein